jgi:hypothetical protein
VKTCINPHIRQRHELSQSLWVDSISHEMLEVAPLLVNDAARRYRPRPRCTRPRTDPQREGADAFATPWRALLARIEEKRKKTGMSWLKAMGCWYAKMPSTHRFKATEVSV